MDTDQEGYSAKHEVTDVTGFKVNGQKLYLSVGMDLNNGEIIADRMTRHAVFKLIYSFGQATRSSTKCFSELIVLSDEGWHEN